MRSKTYGDASRRPARMATGNGTVNYLRGHYRMRLGIERIPWAIQPYRERKEHLMRSAILLGLALPATLAAQLRRASAIAAPAGFIALRLSEKQGGITPLDGDYVLYLRVERM